MRAERCEDVRVELSARLDGEVDSSTVGRLEAHVAACPECRRHEDRLARARRLVRTQSVGDVPDLFDRIVERTRAEQATRRGRRDEWKKRARIAGVAAAAVAVLLSGASLLPFGQGPPEPAHAFEIAREIRAAARSLASYRASYTITERGWHPLVPVRRFRASVSFDAPEDFRLEVRDRTGYPGSEPWPRNDVTLTAGPRRWSIEEPISCPTRVLPGCLGDARVERRTVLRRQPFDGSTELPTDIIVPLETLASARDFEVVGPATVAGRRAWRVRLTYQQALPLVRALQAGGSWRPFRPDDRVDVWIDGRTWFPLRIQVFAGGRRPALSIDATSFETPRRWAPGTFRVPRSGLVKDAGFRSAPGAAQAAEVRPTYVAGLRPYRSGVTEQGQSVLSYARGMTWLKLTIDPERRGKPTFALDAERVALAGGGVAYYQPASETLKRRLHVYGDGAVLHLESNLARAELIEVAGSAAVEGRAIPARIVSRGGHVVRRLELAGVERIPWAELPEALPPGYRFSAASLSRFRRSHRTLVTYFRRPEVEFDGVGIRLTQSPDISYLPPSFERFEQVGVGGAAGRYSWRRGEIEWIDDGVLRAIASPTLDLAELLAIARAMR